MIKTEILADTHYSTHYLDGVCTPLKDVIEQEFPPWFSSIAKRSGLVRGILFFWLGRSYKTLVTAVHHPGWSVLIILQAFLRKKKNIILLEFLMGHPTVVWRRIIHSLWLNCLVKPSLRRVLKSAQVLTSWEQQHYAEFFKIAPDRFFFIPYYLCEQDDRLQDRSTITSMTVMSSGRAACDWKTLFAAAEDTSWPLLVVCKNRDLHTIKKLNIRARAKVLVDISPEEHCRYLQSAAVYVVALKDVGASTGHVRVKNAIRCGAPIIATAVKGLEGYLFDGKNALLVEPGDHIALRNAIEKLLASPNKQISLSRKAFNLAKQQTREQYRERIRTLVTNSC